MINFNQDQDRQFNELLNKAFENAQTFNQHKNQSKMKDLKLTIDQESVNIYVDNGEDKDPINIRYWHIDEWKEDSELVISILNAVQMFYTDKQKLIDLTK